MEENATRKGVHFKPLKYYCRGLEEGIEEMISNLDPIQILEDQETKLESIIIN